MSSEFDSAFASNILLYNLDEILALINCKNDPLTHFTSFDEPPLSFFCLACTFLKQPTKLLVAFVETFKKLAPTTRDDKSKSQCEDYSIRNKQRISNVMELR